MTDDQPEQRTHDTITYKGRIANGRAILTVQQDRKDGFTQVIRWQCPIELVDQPHYINALLRLLDPKLDPGDVCTHDFSKGFSNVLGRVTVAFLVQDATNQVKSARDESSTLREM